MAGPSGLGGPVVDLTSASTVVGLRLRFGFAWVILVFVVTWANDTFAYFAGRFLGRHKLLERVSPKKTWEGFAGGAVGSLAGALAVRALLLPALPPWAALAVAGGGAVLGPLGDLAESRLKRAAGVKDSGGLIPGHGGLLGRNDALLFVAPWVYAIPILEGFVVRMGEEEQESFSHHGTPGPLGLQGKITARGKTVPTPGGNAGRRSGKSSWRRERTGDTIFHPRLP